MTFSHIQSVRNFAQSILTVVAIAFAITANAQSAPDTARTQKEDDFYIIHTVPIPKAVELEVGGMVFFAR